MLILCEIATGNQSLGWYFFICFGSKVKVQLFYSGGLVDLLLFMKGSPRNNLDRRNMADFGDRRACHGGSIFAQKA